MSDPDPAYNLLVSSRRDIPKIRLHWQAFREAFRQQMIDPDAAYCQWQNKSQDWTKYNVETVLGPAHNLKEMIAITQRTKSVAPYFNNLTQEKRIQIISIVIVFDLISQGFFIKDPRFENRRYYFNEKVKEVYSIKEGPKYNPVFESLLIHNYNLLINVDSVLKFIYSYAMNEYKERSIHRFFYYDTKEECLYVSDREKEYYRLDGDSVEKFPNGKHLLFQKEPNSKTIEYIPLEERSSPKLEIKGIVREESKGDYLWQLFLERTNFDQHSNLSLDEQTVQLGLYFYSIPFINMLNTKPIMALIGEKGSGKTFTIKMIGKFLIKEDFAVRILDDKESLIVAVANNLIVVLDNVDYLKPWFQDTITSIATGGSIGKRELYTTLEELEITPSCFIVLTSRNPYFKRDDVADRLLLFHCARITGFVDEGDLLSDIQENRDFLWSLYIDDLNEIVKTLRNTSLRCFQTTHRLADWAKLSYIINSALKISEKYNVDFINFLKHVEYERAAFQFKDDNLLPLLKEFVVENKGKWLTASQLIEILTEYDDSFEITSKTLGKLLNSKSSALKTLIGFDIKTDPHGRIKKYCFGEEKFGDETPSITLEGFLKNGDMVKTSSEDFMAREGGFKNPPLYDRKIIPTSHHQITKTRTPSGHSRLWKEDVLEILKENDGDGMSRKELIEYIEKTRQLGVGHHNKINKAINELLSEDGLIFEPEQGVFKKV